MPQKRPQSQKIVLAKLRANGIDADRMYGETLEGGRRLKGTPDLETALGIMEVKRTGSLGLTEEQFEYFWKDRKTLLAIVADDDRVLIFKVLRSLEGQEATHG